MRILRKIIDAYKDAIMRYVEYQIIFHTTMFHK